LAIRFSNFGLWLTVVRPPDAANTGVDDCFPTEERRKRGRGSEELATDKLRERCAVQRAHTHYTFAKPSAETYWEDPAWEEPAATFQQLAPQGFGEAFAIANGRDRCAMNAAALALHAAVGVQGLYGAKSPEEARDFCEQWLDPLAAFTAGGKGHNALALTARLFEGAAVPLQVRFWTGEVSGPPAARFCLQELPAGSGAVPAPLEADLCVSAVFFHIPAVHFVTVAFVPRLTLWAAADDGLLYLYTSFPSAAAPRSGGEGAVGEGCVRWLLDRGRAERDVAQQFRRGSPTSADAQQPDPLAIACRCRR
jgi:hypothetical protein